MLKLLNLQNVIIYQVREKGNEFVVKIGQPHRPSSCPHCKSKRVHKHSKGKLRKLNHGTHSSGKLIRLVWRSTRYYCPSCKKTFSRKPLRTLVKGRQSYTTRAKLQILTKLQTNSFNEVANQSGLSYTSLRSILDSSEIKEELLKRIPAKGKLSIGVDEHAKGRKKLALTITLIKPTRALLAILPDSNKQDFINFCTQSLTKDQRLRVSEISLDMKKSYRVQLKQYFPNAKLVIDKYHVIAYLNNELAKEYRYLKYSLTEEKKKRLPYAFGLIKSLRRSPDKWSKGQKKRTTKTFKLLPELARFYWLKEDFRTAYELGKHNRGRAEKMIKDTVKKLPERPRKTLTKHQKEILNHFDNLTTNAFTEGVHTKFKLTKRISYGLKNNNTYVKKLLLPFVKVNTLINPH